MEYIEHEIKMEDNVCKGCIYDLTDRFETDVEKFNLILNTCCSCKRGKLKEFQNDFPDLYKAAEE